MNEFRKAFNWWISDHAGWPGQHARRQVGQLWTAAGMFFWALIRFVSIPLIPFLGFLAMVTDKATRARVLKAYERRPIRGWRCRRCEADVEDNACQCTESPSPWEPKY
jgi:hypothetical protein